MTWKPQLGKEWDAALTDSKLDFLPLAILILLLIGITVEERTDNFTRWPGPVEEVAQ